MPYISDFVLNDDNTITVTRIAHNPKKITGSRFGAVLGRDMFQSPFAAWCEITRVAARPFVETPSIKAGDAIEPKLARFVDDSSKFKVVTPDMVWGWDFKNKMNYDFFGHLPVFGGMWDATLNNEDGLVVGLLEIKTTMEKNRKYWEIEGIPEAYKLQAQLYAHMIGTPFYHVIVGFLTDININDPGSFECTGLNTLMYHERVDIGFNDIVEEARRWYGEHVFDGAKSPEFHEQKDQVYLDIIRQRLEAGTNQRLV